MIRSEVASKIDQTLLRPDCTFEELEKFVLDNKGLGFYSLCVPSFFVKRAVELVEESCRISTVIGFPHGNIEKGSKIYEATQAVLHGAKCVDVVLNISAIKSKNYDYIKNEIEELKFNVNMYGECELRGIIETCLLTDEEKTLVTQVLIEAECDVVKTSTGFSSGGATVADVALLKSVACDKIKIKASGGIRDFQTALAMFEAGAYIIGTSVGENILESCENE